MEVRRYWSNNKVNKLSLKVVSKVLSPKDNKTIVSHKNKTIVQPQNQEWWHNLILLRYLDQFGEKLDKRICKKMSENFGASPEHVGAIELGK